MAMAASLLKYDINTTRGLHLSICLFNDKITHGNATIPSISGPIAIDFCIDSERSRILPLCQNSYFMLVATLQAFADSALTTVTRTRINHVKVLGC